MAIFWRLQIAVDSQVQFCDICSKISVVQKRPFVRNSVCSQILEGLLAVLAECSQFCLRSFYKKFERKSITLLVGRGGLRGVKIMNKNIVNQLAFPVVCCRNLSQVPIWYGPVEFSRLMKLGSDLTFGTKKIQRSLVSDFLV